jgi:hypothetical protein
MRNWQDAFDRGAMKLIEKAAEDYEKADILDQESWLHPERKEQNDLQVKELLKEADAISKMFGFDKL